MPDDSLQRRVDVITTRYRSHEEIEAGDIDRVDAGRHQQAMFETAAAVTVLARREKGDVCGMRRVSRDLCVPSFSVARFARSPSRHKRVRFPGNETGSPPKQVC